jgi:hypothetical protein
MDTQSADMANPVFVSRREVVEMESVKAIWTTMNQSMTSRWARFGFSMAVLCAVSAAGSMCVGGEAIQFSNGRKSRSAPGEENKLTKEKLAAPSRAPSAAPASRGGAAEPGRGDARRVNTKEDKRRNLAELEKKNWMAVEPGQLQEEEAEKTAFGVREYDIETAGREKTAADIWFAPKNRDTGRDAQDARTRPAPARASDDADNEPRTGKADSSAKDQPSGRKTQATSPLAPETRLDETFGVTSPAGEPSRRGELGLRANQSTTAAWPSALGGADPLGFGRDGGAKPGSSSLLRDASRAPSVGPGSSSVGGVGAGNRGSSSGFNDRSLTRPGGFGAGSSVPTQPRFNSGPASTRSDPFAPASRPGSGR